jgi:hypothetical protein
MRRCTACTHPDRAAIDAELLQGVLSLRTVAGRHDLSHSALYRHRRRCLHVPTVGDILRPVDGDVWREWNGAQWRPIAPPRLEHLVEVRGRSVYPSWRTGWIPAGSTTFAVTKKVYRRRRS